MSDIGNLLLADAALGHILEQMLRILWEAEVRTKATPKPGTVLTSRGAADLLGEIAAHPDVFPSSAVDWATCVHAAADARNGIVHARAADRCIDCGTVSTYVDAKRDVIGVDRSPETITRLTTEMTELTREGEAVGESLTGCFNAKAVDEARAEAARTNEIQNPFQWHFRQTTSRCAQCSGTERGVTTAYIGPAIVVHPPGTPAQS